jgi:hypothetical protein
MWKWYDIRFVSRLHDHSVGPRIIHATHLTQFSGDANAKRAEKKPRGEAGLGKLG